MAPALDAYAKPPDSVRRLYKQYQKTTPATMLAQPGLIQGPYEHQPSQYVHLPSDLHKIYERFLGDGSRGRESMHLSGLDDSSQGRRAIYEIPGITGLYVYPSLLPPEVQIGLLERLLHRDVSTSQHRTNVHLFHKVIYPPSDDSGVPRSFFDPAAADTVFQPIDPSIHRPFSVRQFWDKKLRWATLGGQYDWTQKAYPSSPPPAFPHDAKTLVEGIFPMKAEAAILNLYSPGDTLSLHRDVSEECDRPLVSISIGCDAIFILGLEGDRNGTETATAAIRLQSGDALLMSGASRYAWHGVPKVLHGTCPDWMKDWPAFGNPSQFEEWRGWMEGKRINLNVRQMFA